MLQCTSRFPFVHSLTLLHAHFLCGFFFFFLLAGKKPVWFSGRGPDRDADVIRFTYFSRRYVYLLIRIGFDLTAFFFTFFSQYILSYQSLRGKSAGGHKAANKIEICVPQAVPLNPFSEEFLSRKKDNLKLRDASWPKLQL